MPLLTEQDVARIARAEAAGIGRLKNESDLANFIRERLDSYKPPLAFPPRFTVATLPTAGTDNEGLVVYVQDAAAGSKFQGSNGSAWVALG